MNYSDNELKQIEKFASIYLKISDIAIILDIPADVLREDIADRTSEVSKAYRRGKAGSKVKLHSQEMMPTQVGSPQSARHGGRRVKHFSYICTMKNFYKILFFLLLFVSFNTQTTNATTVEEKPVYINGGDYGLLRDLYCHLSCVSLSHSDSIKGRCVFTFAISKDGIIDVETIKLARKTTLPDEYVDAAKEAVKHLGKFKPGKMNGTPVKVWYSVPIKYPIPLDKINPSE